MLTILFRALHRNIRSIHRYPISLKIKLCFFKQIIFSVFLFFSLKTANIAEIPNKILKVNVNLGGAGKCFFQCNKKKSGLADTYLLALQLFFVCLDPLILYVFACLATIFCVNTELIITIYM